MKTIFFSLTLALIVLFAGISTIFGSAIMAYDLYSGGPNFMQGFIVFCLGATLFFSASIAYIVTKTFNNTDTISDSLIKLLEFLNESNQPPANPLQDLFSKFGMGMPGLNGTIKTSIMNEDGTITPLGEKTFSSNQERDDIIFKAMGTRPGMKDFKDMTIPELQAEEKKAVDSQNFEVAAAIRDLMNEKNNNKN